MEIRDPRDSRFVFDVWGESITVHDPLPPGVSRWRVRARVEGEWAQWSRWTEIAHTVELPEEPYTIVVDGPGDQDQPSMCRTGDGGYLLVFREAEGALGGEDIAAVRVSPEGNVVWQYLYGGQQDDRPGRSGNTVQPLRDGRGYLLAGVTRSFSPSGAYYPWLLVLDDAGKVLWQRWFGAQHVGCARCVAAETHDGDIVAAAAYQASEDVLSRDIWIVRLDGVTGDTVWQKTYGGKEHELPNRILISRYGRFRGDIIVAGYSYSQDIGFNDPNVSNGWFLRVAADTGEVRHERHYGWDTGWYEYDTVHDIAETHTGELVLAGFSGSSRDSMGFHSRDIWVAHADARGVVDTHRRMLFAGYGNDWHDVPQSVTPLPSGRIVVVGHADRHYDVDSGYFGAQPAIWSVSQDLASTSVEVLTWPPESTGHITSSLLGSRTGAHCGDISSRSSDGSAIFLAFDPGGEAPSTPSPFVAETKAVNAKERPFQQADTTAVVGSAVDMVEGTSAAERQGVNYNVRRW